jgi:hypothetical protein
METALANDHSPGTHAAPAQGADRNKEGSLLLGTALLELDLGRYEEAAAHARAAAVLFWQLGNRRSEGVALSACGAIEAWTAGPDRGSRTIDEAETALGACGDPMALQVPELQRGHIDLRRCQDALRSGDLTGAREFLRAARRRVVAVLMPGSADGAHPAGTPSIADQCEDVRQASRALQRAVERFTAELDAPQGTKVPSPTLSIGSEGAWFRVSSGPVVRIDTRRPLRRLLVRLVEEHVSGTPRPLTVNALFEAGWPGEHIGMAAAANRVYVALTTLRKFGLRDVLTNGEGGYRLLPGVSIVQSDPA